MAACPAGARRSGGGSADELDRLDPYQLRMLQTVTEVAWDATYEGTSVAFVGTTGEAPFRVYALEGPTRVVVEVGDLG